MRADRRQRGGASAVRWSTGVVLFVATAFAGLATVHGAASGDFEKLYAEALRLYGAGDHAAALETYDRAWALKPAPEILYGKARCHHLMGHAADAADYYERFLAGAPEHEGAPKAREFLVDVLGTTGARALSGGDAAAARDAYARAVALHALADPAGTDATTGILNLGLAEARSRLSERAGARDAVRKALGAGLPPALRAQAEAMLRALEHDGGPAGVVGPVPAAGPVPRKGAGAALGLGLSGGAVAVVTLAVVLVVVLIPHGPRAALGTYEVLLPGVGR